MHLDVYTYNWPCKQLVRNFPLFLQRSWSVLVPSFFIFFSVLSLFRLFPCGLRFLLAFCFCLVGAARPYNFPPTCAVLIMLFDDTL
jgi:hypothetical protein